MREKDPIFYLVVLLNATIADLRKDSIYNKNKKFVKLEMGQSQFGENELMNTMTCEEWKNDNKGIHTAKSSYKTLFLHNMER